jgi:hypothetical protein
VLPKRVKIVDHEFSTLFLTDCAAVISLEECSVPQKLILPLSMRFEKNNLKILYSTAHFRHRWRILELAKVSRVNCYRTAPHFN